MEWKKRVVVEESTYRIGVMEVKKDGDETMVTGS
jgi:hypothetical protein